MEIDNESKHNEAKISEFIQANPHVDLTRVFVSNDHEVLYLVDTYTSPNTGTRYWECINRYGEIRTIKPGSLNAPRENSAKKLMGVLHELYLRERTYI